MSRRRLAPGDVFSTSEGNRMPRKIAAATVVMLFGLTAFPSRADDDFLWIMLVKDQMNSSYEYSIFFDANKDGATTCTLETPSDPGGSACPFGPDDRDLSGFIRTGLTCTELEAEIETAGTDWTLVWDEGLGTETVADIDFGTINFNCENESGATEWPSDFPTITNPLDGASGVSPDTSVDWTWPASPVLYSVAAVLVGPNSDVRGSGKLPHPPPPTSWPPDSPLTPGQWIAVAMNEDRDIRTVSTGLTITGDSWPLDNDSGWLGANSLDISDFTVAAPVPSLSPRGIAMLGGLVFAIAVAGLAVQRRRRAL
jgi:hypothetical protein